MKKRVSRKYIWIIIILVIVAAMVYTWLIQSLEISKYELDFIKEFEKAEHMNIRYYDREMSIQKSRIIMTNWTNLTYNNCYSNLSNILQLMKNFTSKLPDLISYKKEVGAKDFSKLQAFSDIRLRFYSNESFLYAFHYKNSANDIDMIYYREDLADLSSYSAYYEIYLSHSILNEFVDNIFIEAKNLENCTALHPIMV